jgi:hypothetical protein
VRGPRHLVGAGASSDALPAAIYTTDAVYPAVRVCE